MAIAGLEIESERKQTLFKMIPSGRVVPNGLARTKISSHNSQKPIVETLAAKELKKEYASDLKSNISQSEYTLKHHLLFETSRRNQIKRLKLDGKRATGVLRRRLHVFKPVDVKPELSFSAGTQEFVYNTNIPVHNSNTDSITEFDDAEIRFLLKPTICSHSRRVTFNVMQENTTLEVDACRVRWESLSLRTIPLGRQTSLRITCNDCALKGVTISEPFLNVITTNTPKKRLRRAAKKKPAERKLCSRKALTLRFKDIPKYQNIVTPSFVDIGRCQGKCEFPLMTPRQYPHLYNALLGKNKNLKRRPAKCCVPYRYENFEYLVKNGSKLEVGIWEDAIAVNCNCE